MFAKKDRKNASRSEGLDRSHESLVSALGVGEAAETQLSESEQVKLIKEQQAQEILLQLDAIAKDAPAEIWKWAFEEASYRRGWELSVCETLRVDASTSPIQPSNDRPSLPIDQPADTPRQNTQPSVLTRRTNSVRFLRDSRTSPAD